MRVDGYIRVSQVGRRGGPRFISPAIQRDQIEKWARLHDAQVGEMFEELDESGARKDRPLLSRALERVESGETAGIVVAKLDRFGRSLIDRLAAVDRIRAAGGTFASVQDGLDLSTDTGKLVLRIMLPMAEWELDRIRTTWAAAAEKAIARGVHCAPVAPAGYRRLESGHLVVDPVAGPIMAEAFRRRANRQPLGAIGRWLEEQGVITAWGNRRWPSGSLRGVFANRAYLGEVHSGPHVNARAHEPLVDAATCSSRKARRR